MLKDVRKELRITYREAAMAVADENSIGSIQNYEKPNVTHRRFLRYALWLAKQKKLKPTATLAFLQELADELQD